MGHRLVLTQMSSLGLSMRQFHLLHWQAVPVVTSTAQLPDWETFSKPGQHRLRRLDRRQRHSWCLPASRRLLPPRSPPPTRVHALHRSRRHQASARGCLHSSRVTCALVFSTVFPCYWQWRGLDVHAGRGGQALVHTAHSSHAWLYGSDSSYLLSSNAVTMHPWYRLSGSSCTGWRRGGYCHGTRLCVRAFTAIAASLA